MSNAKTVARDLARRRKKPRAKKNQHTIGVNAAAFLALKKTARREGVPIVQLASAAVFEGIDEAAKVIRDEIEAQS